jgi:predicted kinase
MGKRASSPLIIFTGLPGTGKTSLSREVASALQLPLVGKDDIKEDLFDTLGSHDNTWADRLSPASMAIVYRMAAVMVRARFPLIVEANFYPQYANEIFQGLDNGYGCSFLQVVCTADLDVLAHRYHQRGQDSGRHPGHVQAPAETIQEDLQQQQAVGVGAPLDIGGKIITIDTTDFAAVRSDTLTHRIGAFVAATMDSPSAMQLPPSPG